MNYISMEKQNKIKGDEKKLNIAIDICHKSSINGIKDQIKHIDIKWIQNLLTQNLV